MDQWWLVIDNKYRIKNSKDVQNSGVYYNESLDRYDVYFSKKVD